MPFGKSKLKQDCTLNALVTGGAGFIGSNLCAALLARGHRVTCVDSLATGSRRNLAEIQAHPDFRFVEHDITLPFEQVDRNELIFHLASPASVVDYLSMPFETLRANSFGTLNMLGLARETGARFLFTSTSEIYGDPAVHPQPETYWGNVNPIGPRACYDESKRLGETTVMEYRRSFGTDVRIVRIFNTYGPHSRPDDGRIIPNFITQALNRRPITIYGSGEQTRSFCYVSDMVEGLLAAMLGPETAGEVFNLGNPDEYTVLEIARIVTELIGSAAGIEYRELPQDDPTRRCPDISKAKRMLDWEPKVNLESGLRNTVAWFSELLAETPAT